MPTIDMGGNDLVVKSIREGASVSGIPAATQTQATGTSRTASDVDLGKLILLDTLTGSTVTLPASTGSGKKFRFLVSLLATSNSHIVKVANATDVMRGTAWYADTDGTAAVNGFATVAASDTITLNRTTTGSVSIGEYIEVEDYAAGFWRVLCFLSNTGTPTTPFSATV